MPAEAKEKLAEYGDLMELETSGITYPAISGHPDIFFCQTPTGLVVAPNLPEKYFQQLQQHKIPFIVGKKPVGPVYPQTASYNAVETSNFLIHHPPITDPTVVSACSDLKIIKVKQAYTRCNLIALGSELFLTSDRGIYKALAKANLRCYHFDPSQIHLEGFAHGFLGGACGVWERKLFVCGNLRYHSWSDQLREIAVSSGFQVIELCDSPLVDIGSILFAG